MNLRKLLYPFTLLYSFITFLRNKCFDWGFLKAQSYTVPIISIGNITVGGTGKTPLTEYIIRILTHDYKLSLLSRGYKRKTKGALLANKSSTAETIGDEPFQMKSKFPELNVTVAEKRVEGMEMILKNTQTDVVLMDDAYQHRYVKPGFSLLVIDYDRPLWNDCPFPAGDLREHKSGQKRADIIVVNKCPESFSETDKAEWMHRLRLRAHQEVFFTSVDYDLPKPVMKHDKKSFPGGMPTIAIAGIAKPEGFFKHVSGKYKTEQQLTFPDHHHFTQKDMQDIVQKVADNDARAIITTEKDAVRFENLPEEIKALSWFIPIRLKVLFNEEKQFENRIRNYVRNNSDNS
ncbi:tetraacyldisaccharide 4'-kinase [Carboxylicivirga marina]|uniref:tetraacyldisaccharide 4'-kinase n=1 Tax=Carboxylicivirga marina TaxID=2800988 RepID=UPI002593083B|nr:tetraacyldisaccharide 4'-kinase [uncultured Carboxylicivirga sp.]